MTELLEQNAPRVFRFALQLTGRRAVAEDLAQETMLRAWSAQSQLRERAALTVWLFRIATNIWRDWQRQQSRRPEVAVEQEPASEQASPDDQVAGKESVRLVLKVLDQLPERQRQVLYLFACEGMSLTEIGEVLDIAPNAVKGSLFKARRSMRDKLRHQLSEARDDAPLDAN